jgi:hypothetical protein
MNFKIEKENEGQEYAFSDDSNAESEIQLKQKRRYKKKIVRKSKTFKDASPMSSAPSSPRSMDEPPMKSLKRRTQPLRDDTYEMFSNPNKAMPDKPDDVEEEENQSDNGQSSMGAPVSDVGDDYNDYDNDDEPKPSEGYKTIDDEKKDLIYKLFRLSSKGIPVSKKYNMHSDLNEMRSEFYRIERDIKVNGSIKFSRRMLMACVTGMEFLNKRYDPFDVYLDGWSETIMENVDDYDNVFEKLHDKYNSKVNMPPEMELLLSLGGSAFMFHLTNTMFKSVPNIGELAKTNPDVMKKMMETMTAAASAAQKQNPPERSELPPETPNSNPSNLHGPREMKKPSIDIASMLPQGMMLPMQVIPDAPMPTSTAKDKFIENRIQELPDDDDDMNSIMSDNISLPDSVMSGASNVKNVSISEKSGKRRGRKPKLNITDENSITI